MSVTKEDLGGSKVRLTVTVPAEVFRDSIDRVYRKKRKEFSVPGFRKGNVPRQVIESHMGPQYFYGDAMEDLFPQSLAEAYRELGLNVISEPENVQVNHADRDDGVVYSVDVYVKPEVALGQYEGLDITEYRYTLTDADVDNAVEHERQQNIRWIPVERPAQNGDVAVISYVGKMDGVPFDGGSSDHVRVAIGAGRMIPGFEEQIVGMVPGEEKTIMVTFPEDYQAAELAGKDATFDIAVSAVEEPELPELDDDFAQDVSSAETLAEFREMIRSSYQASIDRSSASDVESQIIGQIVNNSSADVPTPMVETQMQEELKDFATRLGQQGLTIDAYLAAAGQTQEELIAQIEHSARRSVLTSAVLEKLVRVLETQATDEELESELSAMAAQSNVTLEEAMRTVKPQDLMGLKDRMSVAKTLQRLKETAHVTVVEEESLDAFLNSINGRKPPEATDEPATDAAETDDAHEDTTEE